MRSEAQQAACQNICMTRSHKSRVLLGASSEKVAWPPGQKGANKHIPVRAEQGQGGRREVGLEAFELHNESVILSQQLAL